MMNIPTYEYDPWFVQETLREKQAYAAGERLARQALRTSQTHTPMLFPVRRRLGCGSSRSARPYKGPCPRHSAVHRAPRHDAAVTLPALIMTTRA